MPPNLVLWEAVTASCINYSVSSFLWVAVVLFLYTIQKPTMWPHCHAFNCFFYAKRYLGVTVGNNARQGITASSTVNSFIKVAYCFLRGKGCQAMSGCHLVSAFWWPGAGSLGLWSRRFFPRPYLKVTVLGGLLGAGASFIEWKARLVALISDIVDLVSILTLLLIITAISL